METIAAVYLTHPQYGQQAIFALFVVWPVIDGMMQLLAECTECNKDDLVVDVFVRLAISRQA